MNKAEQLAHATEQQGNLKDELKWSSDSANVKGNIAHANFEKDGALMVHGAIPLADVPEFMAWLQDCLKED